MWEKCIKKQQLGILGPWKTSEEMNEKFGEGQWRPIKRFAVWEASTNKWRAIDNGRSSGHNDAADLFERIHTTSTDMGLAVAQKLIRLQSEACTRMPIQCSTRDMKNAFRQFSRADIHPVFTLWLLSIPH